MLREMKYAFKAILIFTIILGFGYTFFITVFASLLFNRQANGSIISGENGKKGSVLIGQKFTVPRYFHPRPSNAGSKGYDPTASGGSNLAPTNRKLIDNVKSNLEQVLKDNPGFKPEDIPVDAVTSSASGLDPHISIENAKIQAPRVAKARNLDLSVVHYLINNNTDKPLLFVQGEPGVNVLQLNLELDKVSKDISNERR
ncbi:MAG: potassium-transporting ATPase subunit KdpC [Firmicutes bacterium]|nr:potassium-transporting ATPase subunit KdpC [Bacillota bacterium]